MTVKIITDSCCDIPVELAKILNITVVENPIINLIIFEGVKAEKY